MFPYILSDKTLTVIIDNRSYQTDRSNPHWDEIKTALGNPDTSGDELIAYLKPITAVANAVDAYGGVDRVTIRGGSVLFDGQPISSALTARMLDILKEGLDVTPWIKFANNVYANPYEWSREELYLFLEKAELPITPDGCFIAYKKIRADYKDIHSGTIDNSVGKLVVMPGGRDAVDPDRFRTCSYGLHFCSKGYLPHFGVGEGSRVVLLKINPADVVSIPSDYDNTKGRCFRYEVVGEIPQEEAHRYIWPAISSGYDTYQWGPDEDDDYDDDFDLWDDEDDDDEDDIQIITTQPNTVAFVDTIGCGKISKDDLSDLIKSHGTLAGIARALGVSTGTVQSWKTKLFGPANS